MAGIFSAMFFTGCGEKSKTQAELAIGDWARVKGRTYIVIANGPNGEWESSVRFSDAASKVVTSKKNAKGSWHIEKGRMAFAVVDSEIQEVWEKGGTIFYDIVELTENRMQLKNESGHVDIWTRAEPGKHGDSEIAMPMGLVVVNINKNRSNVKDRYLCLNMNIILKELMPGQTPPPLHPKIRDATIIFFSSLVYDDVNDFNDIELQCQRLVDLLNPQMEGMIKKIAVEHVILTAEIDKVEEFMIEHTQPESPSPKKEQSKH
ncbi:MAG: hypothetical protein A3J80_02725 [Desulfobacula sp. RIFOXYB2_FULL_45_6]|nr:MAG: hypothetical protein A3J80_02725 [Desulfobacula sp. RIFOXYB2_FULL_45_6]